MSGRGDHRHSRWAEEVDQEEAQGQAEASGVYDEVSGQYRNSNASWDAGMEVERGQSRHRLDLSHGFMRNIVANQRDRDAYEQSWKEAYRAAGPFQQRWGVGVVIPGDPRTGKRTTTAWETPAAESGGSEKYDSDAADMPTQQRGPREDESSWWRRPASVTQTPNVTVLKRPVEPSVEAHKVPELAPRRALRADASEQAYVSSQQANGGALPAMHSSTQPGGGPMQRAAPSRPMRAPLRHQELEASLIGTASGSYSEQALAMTPGHAGWDTAGGVGGPGHQWSAPSFSQYPQVPPLPVDSSGIALGIPVFPSGYRFHEPGGVHYNYSAGPSGGTDLEHMPAHASANAGPAGWEAHSPQSGWDITPQPRVQAPTLLRVNPDLPGSQPGVDSSESQEHSTAKPRVRFGHQVYRPPPQLGRPSALDLGGKEDVSSSADKRRPTNSSTRAADEQKKAGQTRAARAKGSKLADPPQGGRDRAGIQAALEPHRAASSEEGPPSTGGRKGLTSRKAKAATGAAAELAAPAQSQAAVAAGGPQKPAGYFENAQAACGAAATSGRAEELSADLVAGARQLQLGPSGNGERRQATRQPAHTGGSRAAQHDRHQPATTTAPEHGARWHGGDAAEAAEPKRRRGKRLAQDGGSAEVPSHSPDAAPNGTSSSRGAGRSTASAREMRPAKQQGEGGPSVGRAGAEVQLRMKHTSMGAPPDAASTPTLDPLPASSRSSRTGSSSRAVKSSSAEGQTGADGRPSPLPRAFQLSLAGLSGFPAVAGRAAEAGHGDSRR